MSSPFITPTADKVLNRVTASWYESDLSSFNHSRLPHARVDGSREMRADTSYKLGTLTRFLDNEVEGGSWLPGQQWPASRAIDENTVTISPHGWISPAPASFPVPRNGAGRNRLEDARYAVPQQLQIAHARRDRLLVAAMTNVTTFGNNSWSGTDPFDEVDATGDQDPIGDIESLLNGFRYWKNGDLKLVAAVDRKTLSTMAQKPAFHGAGTGSGAVSRVTDTQMVQILQDLFGFEDVMVFDHPGNSAMYGQTASVDFTEATPFFWMGLVDNRDSDLRSGNFGPGGAIAVGEAITPFVDIKEEPGSEARDYAAKDECVVFTPRYTAESIALGAVITGNYT